MLIDHDSVLFESSIAVTIKFLGKEPFRMAKWICRIVDDDVVIIFTVSQKSKPILVVNGDTRVIKSCSKIWKYSRQTSTSISSGSTISICSNSGYSVKTWATPPSPPPITKDFLWIGMDSHGNVNCHFVVDKVICIRKQDMPV